MPNSAAEAFRNLQQANAAMAQHIGWGIYMNPTNGGHTAQAFGLPGGLEIDYVQGNPAMASADVILFGRPFVPVGRPVILPISPGHSSFPGTFPFGAGIGWDYAEGGGSATFSWELDSGAWQMVDEILSPNQANVQIASEAGGATWQLSVSITSVLDTTGIVILFADGVSKGTLSDGDQVTVTGNIISLGIETEFPTPSQDGFSIGYTLDRQ